MSVEAYDPIANPYAPGAGTPPPELVGRDQVIEDSEIAMRRVISARTSQHQLITGLRGVGKTVLLGKLTALAEHTGFRVIRVEAVGGDDTVRSLLRQSRRLVEDLDRSGASRALRSIESVRGTHLDDWYDATGFSDLSTNAGSNGTFNEFQGMAGDDTIIGNGSTRIAFGLAREGVTVDLVAGMVWGGASVGTDSIVGGVSNVGGSMVRWCSWTSPWCSTETSSERQRRS